MSFEADQKAGFPMSFETGRFGSNFARVSHFAPLSVRIWQEFRIFESDKNSREVDLGPVLQEFRILHLCLYGFGKSFAFWSRIPLCDPDS